MSRLKPEQLDVLIVEDEDTVRQATGRVLTREGLLTAGASDVPAALAALAHTRFRLALADIMLPGNSGFELIGWIRRHRPRTPVVAITGYATTANALESFRLGAFDFIPKPFDLGELLAVVRRGLRHYDRPVVSPGGLARVPPPTGARPRYLLGAHAWAQPEKDGSVTFGIAETLSGLIEAVDHIDLPALDQPVTQGRCWLRIHSRDRLVHRVWAPLSGKVIAVNPALTDQPSLLLSDPFAEGWATRILPEDLKQEQRALTPAVGAGAETVGARRR